MNPDEYGYNPDIKIYVLRINDPIYPPSNVTLATRREMWREGRRIKLKSFPHNFMKIGLQTQIIFFGREQTNVKYIAISWG